MYRMFLFTHNAEPDPEDVYLALGSNLGNRGLNIQTAIEMLQGFCKIKAISHLYDTNPKYVMDQPKFLNCVVKVSGECYFQILKVVSKSEAEDDECTRRWDGVFTIFFRA
jgi:2-amino-4-hydroxy-6-hydroxymethyldihydropteridine diphosphokinase